MLTLTFIVIIFFVYHLSINYLHFESIIFSKSKSELLKVILPFFIILHHTSNESLSDFIPVGKYVVALFFFISGYGLEAKRVVVSPQLFHLFERLKKLLLPVIAPMLLSISIQYAKGQNICDYICSSIFSFSFPLPNSWFIMILALLYVAYYSLAFTRIRHFLFWLVCIVLILNIVLFFVNRQDTHLYASNLAFAMGAIYKKYERRILPFLFHSFSSYLLPMLLVSSCFLVNYRLFAIINILFFSLVIVLMLTKVPYSNSNQSSLFIFFKSISYEMYLCHGIALMLIPWSSIQDRIWYSLSIIIVSVFISYFCHNLTNSLFGDYLGQNKNENLYNHLSERR